MKFVHQSADVINSLSYNEIIEKIEIAGRTCYKSEPKGKPEDFIRMLIRRGHESVLEHASLTFKIKTNRNMTHELVRHRLASYSQESTRYVSYKDGIEFIPWIKGDIECIEDGEVKYKFYEEVEKTYKKLIEEGYRPEEARDILPGSTATTIVMTMNMRELRHFLKLRIDKAAHPQMRELAKLIHYILLLDYPVFVENI